jgi:hypothetical protein
MDENTSEFQRIVEQLSPKTQAYLLNLANLASIAEQSVREEIKHTKPLAAAN